jgi:hypothetical protein
LLLVAVVVARGPLEEWEGRKEERKGRRGWDETTPRVVG